MSKRRARSGKASPDCNSDSQRSHSSPVKARRNIDNPSKRRRLFPKPGHHFCVTLMPSIYVDVAFDNRFDYHIMTRIKKIQNCYDNLMSIKC